MQAHSLEETEKQMLTNVLRVAEGTQLSSQRKEFRDRPLPAGSPQACPLYSVFQLINHMQSTALPAISEDS